MDAGSPGVQSQMVALVATGAAPEGEFAGGITELRFDEPPPQESIPNKMQTTPNLRHKAIRMGHPGKNVKNR